MHFEASYEKRSSRTRSRSPLRPSLRRPASFSSYGPNTVPLGGYVAPAPAPAPWVHSETRITYPSIGYTPSSSYTNTAVATYNPTSTYKIPGAYPDPITGPSSSYIFQNTKTTETKYEYKPTYIPRPPSPRPLENPEVKAAIAHEQNLRMLSEQSHQETLKRQILEMEIAKTAVQRDKVRQEQEANSRMQRLYMLSQQQQQQQQHQMVLRDAARAAEQAHHRYHSSLYHGRSRSAHSRSRSRARSSSRSMVIEYDEHRRSTHVCGRCHHKGHYSKECRHHTTHRTTLLLENGPRSSAPALLGPGSSRGRSRRGSTVCSSEDEYALDSEEDEGWWSDGRETISVPTDSGLLVAYTPGGGPASRRSSFRHVVGV